MFSESGGRAKVHRLRIQVGMGAQHGSLEDGRHPLRVVEPCCWSSKLIRRG
jgi:hypothetical protein